MYTTSGRERVLRDMVNRRVLFRQGGLASPSSEYGIALIIEGKQTPFSPFPGNESGRIDVGRYQYLCFPSGSEKTTLQLYEQLKEVKQLKLQCFLSFFTRKGICGIMTGSYLHVEA